MLYHGISRAATGLGWRTSRHWPGLTALAHPGRSDCSALNFEMKNESALCPKPRHVTFPLNLKAPAFLPLPRHTPPITCHIIRPRIAALSIISGTVVCCYNLAKIFFVEPATEMFGLTNSLQGVHWLLAHIANITSLTKPISYKFFFIIY